MTQPPVTPATDQPNWDWVQEHINSLFSANATFTSEITALQAAVAAFTAMPAGTIVGSGATSVPAGGYLACDGSSQLQATYPALFAAIGTTYGSVDGTHFNLPDLLGRFPMGAGTPGNPSVTGGTAHALGTKGGEETHLLTGPEVRVAKDSFASGGDNSPRNADSVTPHNNLPQFTVINWWIKT